MTRLRYFAPLIAAGAMLALTSGAQAQQLTDGVQTTPFTGDVINLPDANPSGDIGDPTGGTETQINFGTDHNFQYGGFVPTAADTNGNGHIDPAEAAAAADAGLTVPVLGRTYSFTEVNILDVNLNPNPAGGANVSPVYNSCEVNLLVPEVPFPFSDSGFIGNCSTIDVNSTLNMTGGLVGNLAAIDGVANISGGRLGNSSMISGTVNLTGTGGMSSNSTVLSGGVVNILSDDAFIFGVTFEPGSTVNMTSGQIQNLSNLADGTVSGGQIGSFVTINGEVTLSGDATTLSSSTVADGGVLNVTSDDNMVNTNWTVEAGGTLNMEAGELRNGLDIAGEVNISGGGTGLSNTGQYDVEAGGVLNVSGGILGSSSLNIQSGGVVNQSGGDLGVNTDVENGGILNISGGIFGAGSNADGTGPQFDSADLDVASGGTVNFIGTAFAIDGAPINLVEGMPTTITDRGVLTGTLADGQTIEFNLDTAAPDSFAAGSTISVALPATTVLLGDVNLDGIVNFLDISPFIQRLSNQVLQAEADVNQDGVVSFLDISPFIMILTAAGS